MTKIQQAWEAHLEHRPTSFCEYDDFVAGWYAAAEAAANSVYDFLDEGSFLRAQDVIRKELL